MQESTRDLILGIALALIAIWLLVLTLVMIGELEAIRDDLKSVARLEQRPTAPAGGESDSRSGESWPDVRVSEADIRSETVAVTVTISASSRSGDPLYEPPVLRSETAEYLITGDSLEAARFACLDLVTRGSVTTQLVFSGTPSEDESLTLVLNPTQTEVDAYIAPRLDVPVPRGD